MYYPLSAGRNFDEIKRIIIALQKSDANSVATLQTGVLSYPQQAPAEQQKKEWKVRTMINIALIGSCVSKKKRNRA